MRGKTLEMICWYGEHYSAREADIKRGWGMSCCKSHAAIRRDFGRPCAKRADGIEVKAVNSKNRGARRLTPDTRTYNDDSYLVDYGHIMASGYEGHGQS